MTTLQSQQDALALVEQFAIEDLSYDCRSVWRRCPVLTANGEHHLGVLDLGLYADALHRGVPEYCCIGAATVDTSLHAREDTERLLSDSGAAIQILLDRDSWRWRMVPGATPFSAPSPLAHLRKAFVDNQRRLVPRHLMQVKRYRQTYLLDRVFPITHGLLAGIFEHACHRGYGVLKDKQQVHSLYAVALRVLCVFILQDRQLLGPTSEQPLSGRQERAPLVQDLLSHPENVPPDLPGVERYLSGLGGAIQQVGWDVVQEIQSGLSADPQYDFAGVTAQMLGHFYQRALMRSPGTGEVDRTAQREAGIFYTPRFITQMILDRLPVEEVPLDRRYVLDPACGSGSFLLSAEARLAELVDPSSLPAPGKLAEARRHIQGNDRDKFAVDVARLEMVLEHPDVGQECAFETRALGTEQPVWAPTDRFPCRRQPTIIVGNPPFKRIGADDRAARFLSLCLQRWLPPGGLLGMIMPATFPTGKGRMRNLRDYISSHCDVLELWDLPRGTLSEPAIDHGQRGSADIETCAILLRNKPPAGLSRLCAVGKSAEAKNYFRNSGGPTQEAAICIRKMNLSLKSQWSTASVADILVRLAESEDSYPLSTVCIISNGIKPGEDGKPSAAKQTPEHVPWLNNTQGCESYGCLACPDSRHLTEYIRYPGRLAGARDRLARRDSVTGEVLPGDVYREKGVFAGRKILVRKNMDPNSRGSLLRGFIDCGHYPGEVFHVIWIDPQLPNSKAWTYEALLPFINGPLSSLWMKTARTVTNPTRLLRELPLPNLSQRQIHEVERRTRLLFTSRCSSSKLTELIRSVEDFALSKYPLSASDRARIRTESTCATGTAAAAPWVEEAWPIHGRVEDVRPASLDGPCQVILSIPGLRTAYRGPLPPMMPGWALRPGANFRAEIPMSDAKRRRFDASRIRHFLPLPYAYERLADIGDPPNSPTV